MSQAAKAATPRKERRDVNGCPPRSFSELDAQAHRRIDVLGLQESAREAAIDVRQRNAGVQIDALDRPIVDHERERIESSGAGGAADMDAGACAGGGGEIVLLSVVDRAHQVDLVVHRIFRTAPEYTVDPVYIVRVGGDPDRRKILVPNNVSRHVIAADRLEAVRIVIARVGVAEIFIAAKDVDSAP